jgi:hypothetical protein
MQALGINGWIQPPGFAELIVHPQNDPRNSRTVKLHSTSRHFDSTLQFRYSLLYIWCEIKRAENWCSTSRTRSGNRRRRGGHRRRRWGTSRRRWRGHQRRVHVGVRREVCGDRLREAPSASASGGLCGRRDLAPLLRRRRRRLANSEQILLHLLHRVVRALGILLTEKEFWGVWCFRETGIACFGWSTAIGVRESVWKRRGEERWRRRRSSTWRFLDASCGWPTRGGRCLWEDAELQRSGSRVGPALLGQFFLRWFACGLSAGAQGLQPANFFIYIFITILQKYMARQKFRKTIHQPPWPTASGI